MTSWHTVVAAIEMSVAMAYSGVSGWVNGIHGKDDLEGEICNACATNTSEMILIETEKHDAEEPRLRKQPRQRS